MNPNPRHRTVLVEGDNMLRSALARLIHSSEDLLLVADFAEVAPARKACSELKPELVVIDIDFAPHESVAFIDILIREQSQARVLALSGANDQLMMRQLSRTRIHGYVSRGESIEFLEEALLEVASGRSFLPAAFLRHRDNSPLPSGKSGNLTDQEQQILRRVVEGSTSRQIALELRLSPRSVETYRSRILRKLNLPNAAALSHYAVSAQLLARS